MFSAALYARVHFVLVQIAHGTAGAARIRHSLRPLIGEGEEFLAKLGRNAPRECETISAVVPALSRDPYRVMLIVVEGL